MSVQYRLGRQLTWYWHEYYTTEWGEQYLSCFLYQVSGPNSEGGKGGGDVNRIFPASCVMLPDLSVKVERVECRWQNFSCFLYHISGPNSEGGESGLEVNRIFPASCIIFPGLTVKVGRVQSRAKYQDLKEKNVLKRNTSKTVRVSRPFEHICVAWYRWRVAFYLSVFYYI